MIFFDGTYRLQRQENGSTKSSGKWAYSWRVRIIDFSISYPDIKHLRPFAVIATQSGGGIYRKNCAESIGKRICRDFSLDVQETLWIEQFRDHPGQLYVATFKPKSYPGYEIYYDINWRLIMPNELEAIRPFILKSDDIELD